MADKLRSWLVIVLMPSGSIARQYVVSHTQAWAAFQAKKVSGLKEPKANLDHIHHIEVLENLE